MLVSVEARHKLEKEKPLFVSLYFIVYNLTIMNPKTFFTRTIVLTTPSPDSLSTLKSNTFFFP